MPGVYPKIGVQIKRKCLVMINRVLNLVRAYFAFNSGVNALKQNRELIFCPNFIADVKIMWMKCIMRYKNQLIIQINIGMNQQTIKLQYYAAVLLYGRIKSRSVPMVYIM